jgi:predicted nucleotidyltransferase
MLSVEDVKLHLLVVLEKEILTLVLDNASEQFISLIKNVIANLQVKSVFPFGSRLYGTSTSTSDYDLLVVVENLRPYQRMCSHLLELTNSSTQSQPEADSDPVNIFTKVYGEIHLNNTIISGEHADLGIYDEDFWETLARHHVICTILSELVAQVNL